MTEEQATILLDICKKYNILLTLISEEELYLLLLSLPVDGRGITKKLGVTNNRVAREFKNKLPIEIKEELVKLGNVSYIRNLLVLYDVCPVCGKQKRNLSSKTCSYACSNTYFRTGADNGNFKNNNYRTVCFSNHDKRCIICGEDKIVEVHHLDGKKTNNNPNNLIPLCPTHHQYWHSRYKSLIEDKVYEYAKSFGV